MAWFFPPSGKSAINIAHLVRLEIVHETNLRGVDILGTPFQLVGQDATALLAALRGPSAASGPVKRLIEQAPKPIAPEATPTRQDKPAQAEDPRTIPLSSIRWGARARAALDRCGYQTLGDIVADQEKLLIQPNFGASSLEEVKAVLAENGLAWTLKC